MPAVYHDYVNHMLRQFFAPVSNDPPGSVTLRNRAACQHVLGQLYADQFEILRELFSQPDQQFALSVRNCATNHNIKEARIWKLVRDTSKKIARDRGLIDQEGGE